MNRLWGLILGALLAGVLAAACGGGGKSATFKGPNGESVKVSGDTGKLPSDFPGDFPVYKGADYKGGVQTTQDEVKGFYATWETGDSVDKVKSFFEDQFKDGAWKTSATFGSGDTASIAVQRKDDADSVGFVTIAAADGKTTIGVIVGKNPEGASSSGANATEESSGSGGEDTSESSDTGESTPDANTSLPDEVDLPADYPSDRVPLPDGARVTDASSVSSGGQKSYIVEFFTKDDPHTVINYFKAELPKHDWTEGLVSNSGDIALGTWSNGDEGVEITTDTTSVAGYTDVSMVVAVKGT